MTASLKSSRLPVNVKIHGYDHYSTRELLSASWTSMLGALHLSRCHEASCGGVSDHGCKPRRQ